MSTTQTTTALHGASSALGLTADARHKLKLRLSWLIATVFLVGVLSYGLPYYMLNLAERAHSPYHAQLRPSGTIGLKLGILGVALFSFLFLYAIRKRWKWLSKIGKTKQWLDFHILFGVSAPIVITLHSSFKLSGLAGLAYWIMMAVAASGIVGRYLYSQIPRSISAAELTFREAEGLLARLTEDLQRQHMVPPEEMERFLQLPSREAVDSLSLMGALWTIVKLDFSRWMRTASLRRKFITPARAIFTLGGWLPSGNRDLEEAVGAIRMQSWLSTKMLFLGRLHELFHLWHVVHRPFSYSFLVLVVVHITVAMLFGYY
ncbi:MAG: hypothetical protein ABI972_27575 [Acidobacteriota bacterium]